MSSDGFKTCLGASVLGISVGFIYHTVSSYLSDKSDKSHTNNTDDKSQDKLDELNNNIRHVKNQVDHIDSQLSTCQAQMVSVQTQLTSFQTQISTMTTYNSKQIPQAMELLEEMHRQLTRLTNQASLVDTPKRNTLVEHSPVSPTASEQKLEHVQDADLTHSIVMLSTSMSSPYQTEVNTSSATDVKTNTDYHHVDPAEHTQKSNTTYSVDDINAHPVMMLANHNQ
jgi:uncharacterized protein YPO0396